VLSTWDVLSKQAPVGEKVLIYDGIGETQAPSCAEELSKLGALVELVTPDRQVAAGLGALNWPIFLRHLYKMKVTLTPNTQLRDVSPIGEDEGCKVTLWNEYSETTEERLVDTVVIEHGTIPCDELFEQLRPLSSNNGVVDVEGLLSSTAPTFPAGGSSSFLLYRVGDAVSSRNIHAAIYDSLRLCKDL